MVFFKIMKYSLNNINKNKDIIKNHGRAGAPAKRIFLDALGCKIMAYKAKKVGI